jgi:hypothetical protein
MKTGFTFLFGIILISLLSSCLVKRVNAYNQSRADRNQQIIAGLISGILEHVADKKNGTYNLHPTLKNWPKNIPRN